MAKHISISSKVKKLIKDSTLENYTHITQPEVYPMDNMQPGIMQVKKDPVEDFESEYLKFIESLKDKNNLEETNNEQIPEEN